MASLDGGGDEVSVEVQVDAGRDAGSRDFREGSGVEDEHEGGDVRVHRDDGRQDYPYRTESRKRQTAGGRG